MARIQRFTKAVLLNRARPGNVESARAVGGGTSSREKQLDADLANRNSRQAGAMAAQLAAERQANGKVKAQERYNEFQRNRVKRYDEERLKAQDNPTGFADSFDQWHREQAGLIEEEVAAGEGGDFDLDYFRQLMDRDRTSVFQKSFDFESGQRIRNTYTGAEQRIDEMNSNFALSNPSYQEFVDHTNQVKNYVNEVGGEIFSPQDNVKLASYGIDQAADTFLFEQLNNDPKAAQYVLEYGQGGRRSTMDFIIEELEGGGKIHKDNDGGTTKYGVNQNHNKNVDVRNLTKEGALDIFEKKYWLPELEDESAAFQAVAADALFQHGNDKHTLSMIKKANGNPYSLIQIRKDYYAELQATGKEKFKNMINIGDNRMKKLVPYVETLEGGGSQFIERVGLIDPDKIARAREQLPKALKDQRKAQAEALDHRNNVDIFAQIQNEKQLSSTIYNPNIPLQQRIQAIRKADFEGTIRDEYAQEAINYLNTFDSDKAAKPSVDQKAAAYEELMQDLKQLRVELGGTRDEAAEIKLDSKTLAKYQEFQTKVMSYASPQKNLISEAEVRTFLDDFSSGIDRAIENGLSRNENDGFFGRLAPGVQDPYGLALDRIDTVAKKIGRENDFRYKKALVTGFQRYIGEWQSSGDTAADERKIDEVLATVQKQMNAGNFAGVIDPANPPNQVVQAVPNVLPEHVFTTEAEMDAADLPDGTPVIVAGVKGFARK